MLFIDWLQAGLRSRSFYLVDFIQLGSMESWKGMWSWVKIFTWRYCYPDCGHQRNRKFHHQFLSMPAQHSNECTRQLDPSHVWSASSLALSERAGWSVGSRSDFNFEALSARVGWSVGLLTFNFKQGKWLVDPSVRVPTFYSKQEKGLVGLLLFRRLAASKKSAGWSVALLTSYFKQEKGLVGPSVRVLTSTRSHSNGSHSRFAFGRFAGRPGRCDHVRSHVDNDSGD